MQLGVLSMTYQNLDIINIHCWMDDVEYKVEP